MSTVGSGMMLVGMKAWSLLEYTSVVTVFSASCVMILGLLVSYGAGVNIGCCTGVLSAVARCVDLLGADFGVGMLYWMSVECPVVGMIGSTAPGVLLQVFL